MTKQAGIRVTRNSLYAMAKKDHKIPGVDWAFWSKAATTETITFGMGIDVYRLQMTGGWDVGPLEKQVTTTERITRYVKA